MNRFLAKVLIVASSVLVIAMAAGCSSFTVVKSSRSRVPDGARIGLVMWDSVNGFGSMAQRAMEGYITGALLERDMKITTLSNEFMLGEALRGRLIPSGSFSGREAFLDGVAGAGDIQGNVESMKDMLTVVETDDAIARLDGLQKLKKMFVAGKDLDYILAVERFDSLGYAFYMIDAKTDVVVSSFTMNGSPRGVERVLGHKPRFGTTTDRPGRREAYATILRMASYVAEML